MASRSVSCALQCVYFFVVVVGIVSAQYINCEAECRCRSTTMDCSHGTRRRFPRGSFIPPSTETLLMNDNQLTNVHILPALSNLLELSLEDNYITEMEGSPFRFLQRLQVLRLGGNGIVDVVLSAFSGLSHLVRLYLHRNDIKTIEAFGSDSAPSSLEMLHLQHNKLTSIATGTFTGIPLLKELNLSSNNISMIGDASFSSLTKLLVLYLHSNHINQLTNATFWGMLSLKHLTLNNNKILNLPDMVFTGATSLKYLDLSFNNISTITQAAFSGLINLTALNVQSNYISYVEDGAFRDLAKLHTLRLWNNTLQSISASTFTGLAPEDRADNTGVEVLILSRNQLAVVRRDYFSKLTKLRYLTLFLNKITSDGLEDGVFAKLDNLVYLSLYGNRLSKISAATFKGLVSLETLRLGNNQFRSFPPFAFAYMPALTTLDISRNHLGMFLLHSDVLSNLTTLRHLDINGVTAISPRLFQQLPCLHTVNLGRSFTCDCDILHLIAWINRTVVNVEPDSLWPPTCLNRRNRRISLINPRKEDLEITCNETTDVSTTEIPQNLKLTCLSTTDAPTTEIPQNVNLTYLATTDAPTTEFVVQTATGDIETTRPLLPQAVVVGLAVGIPLLLVVTVAVFIISMKMKGHSSAEHGAQNSHNRPGREDADHSGLAGPAGGIDSFDDERPYNTIDDEGPDYRAPTPFPLRDHCIV